MSVILETTFGDITVDLYVKKRKLACFNFLKLCKLKSYNYCTFHTIQKNFLAQTGDPTNTKTGGESVYGKITRNKKYNFVKLDSKPPIKHQRGHISLVNNGKNEFGSQFFIAIGDDLTFLDKKHLVFGLVTEGMELLQNFNDALCDENDQPYQDIWLNHTIVLNDPFQDPQNFHHLVPNGSPMPSYQHLFSERIELTQEIKAENEKDYYERMERQRDKEAKARAKILEIVGDLPKANIKPRENVLFVCKLNPITVGKDLEVIFSRFGTIKSSEIVYDKLTGSSLGYGFIEFETTAQCEQAYMTMDNVLIDDRRIHVDFCQSVDRENRRAKFKRKF